MSSKTLCHKLGDLTDWFSGGTPSKKKAEYWGEDIPWISASSMDGCRYSDSDLKITYEGLKAGSRLAPKGSILLLVRGSTLHKRIPVGIAERDVAFNQDVKAIRVKPGLIADQVTDEAYLYYWLTANEQRLLEMVEHTGIGAGKLDTKRLQNLEIDLPPWPEQRQIVATATALDEKEILNSRINQTLEQMAQAIFKSWFVDFEPVKAKIAALEAGGSEEDALLAAMQAISGKGEAELTRLQTEQPEQYAEIRATAELFPSAMQDSELGEIPEGWEVLPLGKMINLIGGGTPKKSEPSFWNGDIRWFSVKDVPSDGNVFVVDTEDKITEEGLNRSSTKLLPIGTTIITARGTVGKLALTGVSTAMNQSCYGVTANDETGPYLNYLRLSEAVATLKRNTHGAVFDTITRSTFDTVIQPRSCLALRQRFEQAVTPMFEAIRNNLVQSNTLSEARDSLLPKLLSGELSLDAQPAEKEVVNVSVDG